MKFVWVLESCYEQDKSSILKGIDSLLTTKQIMIENADLTYLAQKRFSTGNVDFSDAIITVISKNTGCFEIVVFDKKAPSIGMKLL